MERDLDEIADELYQLRPDAFAAARDSAIRKAREAGEQALARELSKLRRPTQSAWLVNLLWRDQRATMEHLFDLADDLRRAQAEAHIPELQRLNAQRRELESELIRRARRLGQQADVTVSASMQRDIEDTLAAALAIPAVAADVRTGRLVKPASYAGFGADAAAPEDGADQAAEEDRATRRGSSRQSQAERREARAADPEDRRREDAEGRVQEAREALEAAAAEVVGLARAADTAQQHHQARRDQLEELQREMRELRDEVLAAERAALAATRRRDQAEKAHESAAKALERAEEALTGSARRADR
jgi:hypothetical protein